MGPARDRLGREGLPSGASRTEFFWDNRARKSRNLTSGKGVMEPKEGGRKYGGGWTGRGSQPLLLAPQGGRTGVLGAPCE